MNCAVSLKPTFENLASLVGRWQAYWAVIQWSVGERRLIFDVRPPMKSPVWPPGGRVDDAAELGLPDEAKFQGNGYRLSERPASRAASRPTTSTRRPNQMFSTFKIAAVLRKAAAS
jgi:hypothetical protein